MSSPEATAPVAAPSRSQSRRTRLACFGSFAVLALVASGCDGCGRGLVSGVMEGSEVKGAVLKGPDAGKAGDVVTLDATGSRLGSAGPCPESVVFYADDADGAEATLTPVKTGQEGKDCVLVDAKVQVKLAAAATPGVRSQTVKVVVEGKGESQQTDSGLADSADAIAAYRHTQASIVVKVDTPAAAPAATAPAPPAAITPPSHGGGTGHTPVRGAAPSARLVLNPLWPVAGQTVELDGGMSSDPDGSIVAYRWDTDGDGAYDDLTGEVATFVPPAAGEHDIGLEVEDNDGNRSHHVFTQVQILAPGHPAAEAPSIAPPDPIAGNNFYVYASTNPAGFDRIAIDENGDGTFEREQAYTQGGLAYWMTRIDTPGRHQIGILYIDSLSGFTSQWTAVVDIRASARRSVVARAAAKKKKKKAKGLAKALTTTATMRTTAKLVGVGKLSFAGGQLSVQGAIVRGTISGKVPKAAKAKAPAGLRGLYSSEYVGTFSGRRLALSPDAFAVAGAGTILARPKKDRSTAVCLSVKTDGTAAGSTWKVLGAIGRASGFTGSGTFAPVVVGRPATSAPTTLTVKTARAKALPAACRTLAKQLAPAKAKKGKKKG